MQTLKDAIIMNIAPPEFRNILDTSIDEIIDKIKGEDK